MLSSRAFAAFSVENPISTNISTSKELVVFAVVKEIDFDLGSFVLRLVIKSFTPALFRTNLNPPQS